MNKKIHRVVTAAPCVCEQLLLIKNSVYVNILNNGILKLYYVQSMPFHTAKHQTEHCAYMKFLEYDLKNGVFNRRDRNTCIALDC